MDQSTREMPRSTYLLLGSGSLLGTLGKVDRDRCCTKATPTQVARYRDWTVPTEHGGAATPSRVCESAHHGLEPPFVAQAPPLLTRATQSANALQEAPMAGGGGGSRVQQVQFRSAQHVHSFIIFFHMFVVFVVFYTDGVLKR